MKNNYSFFEQILHRLSVGNPLFNELSFDLEKSLYLTQAKHIQAQVIFISGLARSGTTSLLNHLVNAQVGQSLSYQELPFLFMPNLSATWRTKKTASVPMERAHGDQILINEDSPEAIDEIFWKSQLTNSYIKERQLELHELSEEDIIEYKHFIQLHLVKSGREIYLTKNNNSILRLNSLANQSILSTRFIFTIREPYSHARSLWKQHIQFAKIHQNDAFSRAYFNSLGHHEFGLNLKSFDLGNKELNAQLNTLNPMELDYWLVSWLNYYQHLFSQFSDKWLLVDFQDLCSYPNELMNTITKIWELPSSFSPIEAYQAPKYELNEANCTANLLEACKELYLKFKPLCLAFPSND
ncbi:MAG: hypothetical protein RLZZ185_573 [Bacteroidota bacterium]|jgi:hypothetical protein